MTERVALVTGGGSGIGREICVGLAAAGRHVAVADLNLDGALETASLISATGGTAIAVHMDVADSDAVQGGILQVLDELGPPEILVNCAGWDELMPFLSTDEDFWDRVIEINYKGCTTHSSRVSPFYDRKRVGANRKYRFGCRSGRFVF